MFALAVNVLPDLLPQSGSQCFPFYTYNEDGTNRRENITDWALEQFRAHYKDKSITKWDIFHYVYALAASSALSRALRCESEARAAAHSVRS